MAGLLEQATDLTGGNLIHDASIETEPPALYGGKKRKTYRKKTQKKSKKHYKKSHKKRPKKSHKKRGKSHKRR